MFSKKPHADVKKSTQKLQDHKKDSATRFKHLRIILDNVDIEEAKLIFEVNFSHIYYVLYDCFIAVDNNLKQKELPFPLVHKAHREELEAVLTVLDKIFTLLPEHLSRRWQCHSITRLLTKLLHPGNSHKLRREALRFFLIWYQILGENSPDEVHALFATLVPGFFSPFPEYPGLSIFNQSSSGAVFHDSNHGPVSSVEIQPVYTPPSGEKQPEDLTRYFLDSLLEFMVTQVPRIEWKEKFYKQHRCFTFLFERFKEYYLPHIFPNFSKNTDLFKPYLEISSLRVTPYPDVFISCKVAVIKWVTNFTHLTTRHPIPQIGGQLSGSLPHESLDGDRSPGTELHRVSVGQTGCETPSTAPFSPHIDSHIINETPNVSAIQIVRDVLYMSRDNVNFIHEVYRQSFILNFSHSSAIRRVVSVYKDWIQMNVIELPPFMLEPLDSSRSSGPSSSDFHGSEVYDESTRLSRIRNDSYIGAIDRENIFVRAGRQNVLQVFVTDAANVFLLDIGPEKTLLDEQVDVCKRVLNIYRYMVMHTHMEARTWEQLLLVLLHVTSIILNPAPPKTKDETLGGRLAPAIFQTLIVTWIKANLNVVISCELWDQFLAVLSSLTLWDELIKEWAKTMETLTRVLARHVYGLELTDLPLDRLSEQKIKRQRGGTKGDKCETPQPTENENLSKSSVIAELNIRIEKEISCPLRRSASDSNLLCRRRRQIKRKIEKSIVDTGIPNELDLYNSSLDKKFCISYRTYTFNRRWRSLDSAKVYFGSGYEDSECATRTPSPAPSSGVESNSFKDSPLQIEVLTNEGTNIDVQDGKSVMSGGSVKGWLPDVAAVLWLRMLGALGDINKISDPMLHSHVFHFLVELFDTLVKIRLNQGIPNDTQNSTPPVPELVPPLTILAPWCFQALSLPTSYHSGKLSAYRLLCHMTVMVHEIPLHPKHLSLFYSTIHDGLLSNEQSIINTIIKHCGPRFFSLQLPGFSLLLLDFIQATESIVSSTEVRNIPRSEAISILGVLLSMPQKILKMPVLDCDSTQLKLTTYPDIRDRIVNIILKAGKTEPAGVARCIALSNLGIFLYQELCNGSCHPKIKEAINTLLLALRFNHKIVAQSATDILLLLCDHAEVLYKTYSEIPPRIVEVLVGTLAHLMPVGDSDKRLLTSLLFCLGEWTMSIPIQRLVLIHNGTSLLSNVLKVLDDLSEGGKGRGVQVGSFHPDLVQEFNSNITYDDLKQQDLPQPRRPVFPSSPSSPVHLISTTHSIQLAAKLVMMHLVNNLGHFPLASGGANLGSVVVEQDDVFGLEADQLSSQLFSAPNIQVFVTSLQQVVSLVEVPALDVPGGGAVDGLISAPSQVRIIVRDLAGKASWDASVLYGTPIQCSKADPLPFDNIEGTVNNSFMNSLCVTALSQDTLRHRPPHVLPTFGNSADDMDNLDDLLQYIGHTSPEILENLDVARNVPPTSINVELEEEAMGSILSMRIMHQESINQSSPIIEAVQKSSFENNEEAIPFQFCRILFSHLGMHAWDLRNRQYLVDKNERLLREMRNLDSQRCRQTHKVAVIYVALGQEDKNSILSNSGGSLAYEDFIAGLAWEVELETHMGFRGGLQRNKMTGVTAPYYATSFTEVMFHVSTRMPTNNAEALLQKTRHLGNDEVHIVWSEHTRDYRRGIIPTEFCDVLIVIYPLPHNLYRIQVSRKPDVPYFGPLYNEALVGHKELPGLVRATALSASRAKRSMLPFYQQYYEERGRSLETVIKNFKRPSTFEEFAANFYSPQEHISANICQSSTGSGSLQNEECSTSSAGSTSSSTLAALLDSSTYKMTSHSYVTSEESGTSCAGGGSEIASSSGISPRPLKKLVMKSGNKKAQPLLTPPDSPTSKRSK